MTLLPFGQGIGRSEIVTGSIWTTDDGRFHAYSLEQNGTVHRGRIPKTKSGHKNPFDLLKSIAEDILNV